jgi:hypothetical protein
MRWPRFRREPRIPLGTYRQALLPRQLTLAGEETRSHVHLIGKSGSGKSRWLAAFYVNLLKAGCSATLIDPHGDLARLVLATLVADGYFRQPDALDRLHYLDIPAAARAGRYLRFNVLEQPYPTHETTRLILDALRRAFPELDRNAGNAAPAFEQTVAAGVHVLAEHGLPFPLLRRLLLDKPWRDHLLTGLADDLVVSVFRDELDRLDPRERQHLAGSTLRRLFLLLYSPVLRHALAAPDNLLDYRTILDRNRSLIVNLALPDVDTQRLLGCLLTVFAEQGARGRAELPAGSRFGTHYLILDEFHQFVAQSADALTGMLSQTRKFGLFVVLSHQTRDQVPERLRGALQNVELDVVFRTGRQDAEVLARGVGTVDPLAVKKQEPVYASQDGQPTVIDYRSREFTLAEQWELITQRVAGQPKRHAVVSHPSGAVVRITSPHLPDPHPDPAELARIEEHYLQTCFLPASEISPARNEEEVPVFTAPPRRPSLGLREAA